MPEINETKYSNRVLSRSRNSIKHLFQVYDARADQEKSRLRAPTDNEQDLLRAALVFAAAGLDSSVKHLLRGSLPKIASSDPEAAIELEKYIQRQVRGIEEFETSTSAAQFLAKVLSAKDVHIRVLEEYIKDLTGESMQSAGQLIKAAKALGLEPNDIGISESELQPIFQIRNDIIHELDIKFKDTRGRGNTRRRDEMYEYSLKLLQAGEMMVSKVEEKLANIT